MTAEQREEWDAAVADLYESFTGLRRESAG